MEFFKSKYKENSWSDKTIDKPIELYFDDCKNRNLYVSTLAG